MPTNEDLRKQYFEQKKAEFELGCREGSATACFSLGEWYQLIGKDIAKAAELYDKNCFERVHGNSCFNLATLYYADKLKANQLTREPKLNGKDNKERAYFFLDKACKHGNSQSCGMFASMKLKGIGCQKDVPGAINFLEKACDANDPGACLKLGTVFLKPETYGVKRDPARSFKAMDKGCSLGHPNCCQVLAVMYKKGDGVPQNNEMFEKYKKLTEDIIKQTGERMGVEVV